MGQAEARAVVRGKPSAVKPDEKIDRQFVKGGATTVILRLLDESPMHGYELIQTIRERTGGIFEFGDGTIYPLLYSLRAKGFVRTETAMSREGRVRKIYRLTPAGRTALERHLADWRLFSRGMALAIGTR
jgi:DNA-binding PadR family transcriptional regulator